ncbi:MAG: polysaccharide lyase [Candidatus Methylacidiphilales bacterium]|nr:polysaccharide lyase [Candidatus Methylacidiphilales bacterium]
MHRTLLTRGVLFAGLLSAALPLAAQQDAAKEQKPAATSTTAAAPAAANTPAEAVLVPLVNTTFKDEDKNGIPDGWKDYPSVAGNTAITAVDGGGVKLKDDDEGNGIGLAQWIPVTPGAQYIAGVELEGTGSLSLNLIFVPSIPAKEAMVGKITLGDKREFYPASGSKEVVATAPAGANFCRVWLYCPKTGKCDVTVKSLYLKTIGGSTTPMAAASAKPGKASGKPGAAATAEPVQPARNDHGKDNPSSMLAPGQIAVIDFETNDFSQVRVKEGGKKEVVSAPEPVRFGKHAMRVNLTHDQHRTEVTSFRSAPSGEYKYGWSVYLPQEFDGSSWFSIVTQWHTWGTGPVEIITPPGPPTCIVISKDQWNFLLRYQDGDSNKATKKEFKFGNITADKGKWTDFVLEVNWQGPKGTEGYLRLYKNGEKVVDYQGVTFYDDKTSGPFFKMGIYKGAGSWKGEESGAVLYFDEFRMAGKETPLHLVDPNPDRRNGTAPAAASESKSANDSTAATTAKP